MQALAQNLQSQGRGNDTMLVHMTPKEVGGLQSLANTYGGSLTTNPQTGLPEAGFLDSILPAVAGFALAPVMGPAAAGLLVGGGTAALTGDINRGLTAGLGAFGGGSLAGLGGVGSVSSGVPTNFMGSTANLGAQTYGQALSQFSPSALGAAGAGKLATAGLAAASPMLAESMQQPDMSGAMGSPAMIRPFKFDPGKTSADKTADLAYDRGENVYFRPTFEPLTPYRADGRKDGGIVALNAGGMPAAAQMQPPSRFLRGPGDGVSDSIPASINQGERPAALSDGEYVIDARGVAEIGNGSSMAGAKKLNSMMSRIHNARKSAGKGEDMDADRFLLA